MKRPSSCRLRKVQCGACGYTVRATRAWMLQGMPTCACGEVMQPTEPSDLAFIGVITEADMSQAAWNQICRENGWNVVRNQGQAARMLTESVFKAASKPQCEYPGCGRWVAGDATHCREHAGQLVETMPF